MQLDWMMILIYLTNKEVGFKKVCNPREEGNSSDDACASPQNII